MAINSDKVQSSDNRLPCMATPYTLYIEHTFVSIDKYIIFG